MDYWKKRVAPGLVEEVQPSGLNQFLLFKLALVILVVLGVATFTTALLIRPEVGRVGEGPGGARAEKQLTEILERLRATWDPRARQRILDEAPQQDGRFIGSLRRILGRWNHPLRVEAVEYAGAFGSEELRSDVANLAVRGRAELRAAAVRATERLGPWANEDLTGFLATGIVEVQVAVLEIVAERQDGPWRDTILMLASEDPAVAAAAVAAVPRQPPPKAAEALWRLIQAGPAEVTARGLMALAHTDRIREFELAVTDLMGRPEPGVQFAALECLSAKGALLARPEAVRDLAWDSSFELEVRAKAFHCLEETRSYDVEALRTGAFSLEPRLQYFAARCLIAAGDARGLIALTDLAETAEADVALACRRLLAGLTGSSPQATIAEFRASIDKGVDCAGPLPAPSVSF